MTKIQHCKNCKHLGHDGMFGLICDVNGDNTKYDCSKYEEDSDDGMTEKRFYLDENGIQDREYEFSILGEDELVDIINSIVEENKQLKQQLISILKLTKKIEDYTYDIKIIGDLE